MGESEDTAGMTTGEADTTRAASRRIPADAVVSETMRSQAFDSDSDRVARAHLEVLGERRLTLGSLLGRGGMGIVRAGVQETVGREVAVKSPVMVEGRDHDVRLLQEAWITGSLEHPNIVPIYDIELLHGQPHVVMKRVDGQAWEGLIDDPDRLLAQVPASDALAANLRVLIAVCTALEYAHSRGVIHRDLKPANVLVGHFGEVYLADWGLAVCLDDDRGGRLPRADEQEDMVGTPVYMAPEMVDGYAHGLTTRTDVFLLGGLLYRIVAGRPPRASLKKPIDLLSAAWKPIPIDPSWPLAPLLERALAVLPKDRPESAAAFRAEVSAWLDRRSAARVLQGALEELDALVELVSAERTAGMDADALHAHRVAVYERYSACRFGLSQTAALLPDDPRVADASRQAVLTVAGFELEQGDDRAATLLLDPLPDPPADLLARATALREARQRAREQLDALAADNDPRTAWQARIGIVAGICGIAVMAHGGAALVGIPDGYPKSIGVAALMFVSTAVLMLVFARWLVRSRLNRVILAVLVLLPLHAFALHTGCWLGGVDAAWASNLELFMYFCVGTLVVLLAEWRVFPTVLALLVAWWLSMAFPGSHLLGLLLINAVTMVNIMVVWVPSVWRRELPDDRPLL